MAINVQYKPRWCPMARMGNQHATEMAKATWRECYSDVTARMHARTHAPHVRLHARTRAGHARTHTFKRALNAPTTPIHALTHARIRPRDWSFVQRCRFDAHAHVCSAVQSSSVFNNESQLLIMKCADQSLAEKGKNR
jgi:hypothetical protein